MAISARRLTTGAFLLATSALTFATAAHADQAPATTQATTTDSGEIIVTAQKREESVQRVPISIQALGAVKLEQQHVQAFDDYAKMLPSVSFQSFGPGQSQLFFRGITSGGDGLPFGALPTSGVYLNEIPVTTIGSLLDVHIYDVSRVEALSGPQGTLYGASSLSGTLRIITNKPDLTHAYGAIDVTADKYGKGTAGGTIEGFVNLPVSKSVAVRLVGWYEHDGGYIDNTYKERTYQRPHTGGEGSVVTSPLKVNNAAFVKNNFNDVDTAGGRVAMLFDLGNDWTITPELTGQYQKSHGSFLYDPKVGDLQVHDFAPESNTDKWLQASLTIKGKIGTWDLVYAGGYMTRKITQLADYSYYSVAYDATTNANFFQTASGQDINPTQYFTGIQSLNKFTNELRVSSPAGGLVRFTGGLFQQVQRNNAFLDYYAPGVGQNAFPYWWDGSTVSGDAIFLTNARIIDRDYAAFGEETFSITPNLTLTAGLRAFISNNTITGFSGFSYDAPASCGTPPFPSYDSCANLIGKRAHASGETHKVNLSWQIDPAHMLYATYSTGFRPGGNNRRVGVNSYDPDTLSNLEFGWKTRWFNNLLTWNGAVYYEKWSNMQYALIVAGSGGVTNIYNAGNARVYGIESDLTLRPAPGFTLSASGAYNDAALSTPFCVVGVNSSPDCSQGITVPAGRRLPVQPRFKINATARYEFPLGDVNAHLQAAVLHQSGSLSLLGVSDDAQVGDSDGFTTVDFAAGGVKGATSVELFIQNAFDTRGSLTHNIFTAPATSGGYSRIYPIKPQYFGIKIGQKF